MAEMRPYQGLQAASQKKSIKCCIKILGVFEKIHITLS
jgi:hypothetical protein